VLDRNSDSNSVEWRVLLDCANPNVTLLALRPEQTSSLTWQRLLAIANEQGLLPLLTQKFSHADPQVIPPEAQQTLKSFFREQTIFDLRMLAEMYRILDRFAAQGIAVMATKGPVLAQRCYGFSFARQYTDLDFVLRNADVLRATETLISLGYDSKVPPSAIRAKKPAGEYAFTQLASKLLVELHTEKTFRYYPNPLSVDRLLSRKASVRLGEQDVPALSIEDELLLISIHGAKHFWERLLWIADVAALITHNPIDWDRATAIAREVDAERMLYLSLLLAKNIAGAALPAAVQADAESDLGARHLANQIADRLPQVDDQPMSLLSRALFRIKMRGGGFPGLTYLLRLTLAPTEEDWLAGPDTEKQNALSALERPLRLARKYGKER
jgi:putative nucleotidyltransferase-like protein